MRCILFSMFKAQCGLILLSYVGDKAIKHAPKAALKRSKSSEFAVCNKIMWRAVLLLCYVGSVVACVGGRVSLTWVQQKAQSEVDRILSEISHKSELVQNMQQSPSQRDRIVIEILNTEYTYCCSLNIALQVQFISIAWFSTNTFVAIFGATKASSGNAYSYSKGAWYPLHKTTVFTYFVHSLLNIWYTIDIEKIFLNIEKVLSENLKFLQNLTKRILIDWNDNSKIGDVFLTLVRLY